MKPNEMDLPIISIVIPVFNSEQYLNSCVNSVLKQTFSSLELILVNDGSTDSSLEKCKAFALTDARVNVIDQSNKGVSSARNAGINMARGTYIMFVDSDDTIDLSICEKLYSKMQENNFDLALCGYSFITNKGNGKNHQLFILPEIHDICNSNSFQKTYRGLFNKKIYLSCCGKLFKTEILKEHAIFFDENLKLGEDLVFLQEYFKAIKTLSIGITNKSLYNYYIHSNNSLSKSLSLTRVDNAFNLYKRSKEFYDFYGILKVGMPCISLYYLKTIIIVFNCNTLKHKEAKIKLKEILSLPITLEALQYLDKKHLEDFLYFICLRSKCIYLIYGLIISRNLAIRIKRG